jgi:HNH endonuclease
VKKSCAVDGCVRVVTSHGMCQLHGRRFKAHGDVHKTNRRNNADGKGYWNVYSGEVQKGLHVLIAEKALGRELPKGAEVHHVNGDRSDNSPGNLVICQDHKYHALLHTRTRAHEATGDANKRKCMYCRQYDSLSNLSAVKDGRYFHAECNRAHVKKYAPPTKRGMSL